FKEALDRDNFKADTLNLATTRAVPDDAAAVVVAGPANPFLPEEKDALNAYLDRGGSLMVLMDPQSKADLNDLFSRWDVQFSNYMVVEPARAFLGDARVPVVDTYGAHAITRELDLGTFYPAATSITVPNEPPGGASIVPVAQTTDRSWAETDAEQMRNPQQLRQDDADPRGPLSVAVAIEQSLATDAAAPSDGGTGRTRVFLLGTARLVENQYLGIASGNQDLVLNALNWLAEEENLVSIRPRPSDVRTMLLTGPQLNLVVYSSMLFLPLAVLVAGAAIWWTRR
ncbi:MAG: Gldg family protein, partial [Planctomycetes bacterium]|nr:Gldg family protein [Planctomycetota bacterium]